MPWVVDWIRKAVVLVLLMEVVLQLQAGKQYESYLKMLVGIMVVYSITVGILGAFSKMEGLEPMKEFQWDSAWFRIFEKDAADYVEAGFHEQENENEWMFQQDLQSIVSFVEIQVEVTVPEVQIDIGG